MILGIGTDIVQLARITRAWQRRPQRFMQRIYTEYEQDYIFRATSETRQIARMTSRFAAKEAAYKAIGGAEGISWKDIEVRNTSCGAPQLTLSGNAYLAAQDLLKSEDDSLQVHLSLSDEADYAVAFVTLSAVSPKPRYIYGAGGAAGLL